MRKKVNTSQIREVNKKSILSTICNTKITSRSKLSKDLGLSKPAISDNLSSLIDLGIIHEIGEGSSTLNGGRRPVIIKLNETFRYIIAIDLNYESPIFVLANLQNDIIYELEVKIDFCDNKIDQVNFFKRNISILLEESGISINSIYCITIASPGAFSNEGVFLGRNPNFYGIDWSKFDFITQFEKVFGVRTIVMNDINAAALGQWSTESEPRPNNLLFISCGIGLGAGLILDGCLYEGETFNVGEIFNYIDFNRMKRHTTIEREICMSTLLYRCKQDLKTQKGFGFEFKDIDSLDFEWIVKAYNENNEVILNIIRNICDELCVVICNFTNFLPVQKVVLGGDYSAFGELLISRFEQKFKSYCNSPPTISVVSTEKYSGIYGLLLRARNLLFDTVCSEQYNVV